ncbi:MAG: flagellar hook-associated protein FlgK [Proteobacteria bacterium]|nr:flagellar hook-associated protein FlgK [Pseudomonadota bacterium]MBU1594526.1 flagellar hook-associated protein FlgK [Pseudomonadota bacterium]
MFGPNSILDIGRSGLFAAQAAISVTGENIANVGTEGYSRRTVRFDEAFNIDYQPGQVGTGVWAGEIQRHFDQFVETQYYDQASLRDRWDALYTQLQGAESLFNESQGFGLSSGLSAFFDRWENLTQRPEDAGSRSQVIEGAQTLVSTLHQADTDLVLMQQKADTAVIQEVAVVNDLLKQIADLNTQIKIHDVPGSNNANQLYDKRAMLVRDLASELDINYIDKGSGNITITTKAGQTLVDNEQCFYLSYDAAQSSTSLMAGSAFDGQVYFQGNDNLEYTLEITSNAGTNFTVSNGAAAATFRVSVDGGNTWLKNADGTEKQFYARPESNMVEVGNIKVYFGSSTDDSVVPSTAFTKGDRFTIVPKKALYWNQNTSTKENISPVTSLTGMDDPNRLTGGKLAGLFNFKDDYVGKYRENLDAIAQSLIWELNRRHSQGVGLEKLTDVQGSYSVVDDTRALASGSSGLIFGSKLTSGSANIYVYNSSTGLLISGAALDFNSSLAGQQNFNPATASINDVRDAFNSTFGTYLTASVVNHKLSVSAKSGYTFAFGTDTSGLVAALGVNTFFAGSNSRDIEVNTKITTNNANLCTGHVNGAGEANQGDPTTAKAIADLRSDKVNISTVRGGAVSQSVVKYYDSLVATVGADSAKVKFSYEYKKTLASDLNDRQQSISGVNLDEEMASLIKYQHAYTAAAKLITTADQMMQTLLSLKP